MKKLPVITLAAFAAASLALPAPASALPRTMEAFEVQMNICREGLDMVVNGATDDEELAMYQRKLDQYGWDEEGDLDDLMLLCAFYKNGWLYARQR